MRLAELKKLIDLNKNDSDIIIMLEQPIYNNQRFEIENYSKLMSLIKALSLQSWSPEIDENIKKLLDSPTMDFDYVKEISPQERQSIRKYLDSINPHIPILYAILKSFVIEKEENIISIKLVEENVKSFDSLNEFNKEIQDIFKFLIINNGINGNIKFVRFDIGSSWYDVLIYGCTLAYPFIMGGLNIVHKVIKIEEDYWKKEEVKTQVRLFKKELDKTNDNKIKEKDLKDYAKKYAEQYLEDEILKLKNSLNLPLKNAENEFLKSTKQGIKKLKEHIKKGVEYHPSLNSPSYIEEDKEGIKIDYDAIKSLYAEENKNNQVKNLENTKISDDTGEEKTSN